MKVQKQYFLLMLHLLVALNSTAQKEDYVWLQGYDSKYGYNQNLNHWFGISKFDFNDDTLKVSYDSLGISFYRANTSFCNNDGNLIFYTNGMQIRNGLDEVIENADSLNWGAYATHVNTLAYELGYATTQGIFALASPSFTSQYYVVNTYIDTNMGGTLVRNVRYHLLDMNQNAGHGELIQRDVNILQSVLALEMAAIRHGNGRDWWIIARQQNSNCYHRILLDPTGIHELPNLYCGGGYMPQNDLGAFAVSPDGSKVAHLTTYYGINIFDFDRCNGELSNPINIPVQNDTVWTAGGLAISPNGRFLYAGMVLHVRQYDLQAPDIAASMDTIAVYDGSQNPFGSYFQTMQLGPDGKIYESCGNSETVYHVINYPDKKGDSCEFVQHGIDLPSYCLGVPYFPNYRLGALPGSPCDTLGTSISQPTTRNPQLTIFPNPATEFVVIDYATAADWSKGELHLFIYDTKGAVTHHQPLPMYSGFQKIACTQWPSGVYQATIKRGETTIAVGRVVKQ
ncbi:MAG: T9SS type A sorting domain-containing protein [Chitinophagales bacterium]|nr:T9SS type A sorting domain-containing protein [Chitinophagales bacterium]